MCPQCQAPNQRDSAFCGNCGNPLADPSPRAPLPQSTILTDPGRGAPAMPGPAQPPEPPRQYAPGGQDHRYSNGAGPYQQDYQQNPGPYQQNQNVPHNPWSKDAVRPDRQFRLDLRRLSRVDQTVGGASLVVLISLFLPWFGFSDFGDSFSANATTSHGYLVLVVLLAVALIGYLVLRAGWDDLPVSLPIAHAPLLLIGTGLQLLLVLIGFFDVPAPGLSWEIGAYLALIASVAAAAPVIVPAVRSWQGSR